MHDEDEAHYADKLDREAAHQRTIESIGSVAEGAIRDEIARLMEYRLVPDDAADEFYMHVREHLIAAWKQELDYEEEPPLVFIGVEGGVGDWDQEGNVLVVMIDWDMVEDDPEYAQGKLEEFEGDARLTKLLGEHSWDTLRKSASAEPVDWSQT